MASFIQHPPILAQHFDVPLLEQRVGVQVGEHLLLHHWLTTGMTRAVARRAHSGEVGELLLPNIEPLLLGSLMLSMAMHIRCSQPLLPSSSSRSGGLEVVSARRDLRMTSCMRTLHAHACVHGMAWHGMKLMSMWLHGWYCVGSRLRAN